MQNTQAQHLLSTLFTAMDASCANTTESTQDWVWAYLYEKHGSSYRKTGAFMFIGPQGERIGLLSGGCLEQDISRQAMKTASLGQDRLIEYNAFDFDDDTTPFNTGCEGHIKIALMRINVNILNALRTLHNTLTQGHTACCELTLSTQATHIKHITIDVSQAKQPQASFRATTSSQSIYTRHNITPIPKLLVLGGGSDAVALCTLGHAMGWQLELWDERAGFAKPSDFQHTLLRTENLNAHAHDLLATFDAIIIKHHNLSKDSQWLAALAGIASNTEQCAYIGLLGPKRRKAMVVEEAAKIAAIDEALIHRIHSPAGLNIGGDTPEAVALSILSHIHQTLFLEPASC